MMFLIVDRIYGELKKTVLHRDNILKKSFKSR